MTQLVRIKKVKYLLRLLQVQAHEVMGGNERKQQNMRSRSSMDRVRGGAQILQGFVSYKSISIYFKKSFRGHGEKGNYWVFKDLLTMNKCRWVSRGHRKCSEICREIQAYSQ